MEIKKLVKGIKNPKRTATVIYQKLLTIISHDSFRRFIVLSRSRTGTNLLISFLNSHPNISAEGEIFSKLNGKNHKDVLSKVFDKQPLYVKAKGFKIFYYHPLDDKSNGVWNTLLSMDNLHVIHLKRKNILQTLISRKIAGVQNVWIVKAASQHLENGKKTMVTFTEDELRMEFEQTRRWEQHGDDMFKNHPLLSIHYEDLVNHREPTFHKVTDFLGVKYFPPETDLKKQNKRSMKEVIKNYEELKSTFSETEWLTFFED